MAGFKFGLSTPQVEHFADGAPASEFTYKFSWLLPESLTVLLNLGHCTEKPHLVLISDFTTLNNIAIIEQQLELYKGVSILVPSFFSILPPHADRLAALSSRLDLHLLPYGSEWQHSIYDDNIRIRMQALPLDANMLSCAWKVDFWRPKSGWLHASTAPMNLGFALPSTQSIILAPQGYTDTTPINAWLRYLSPVSPAILFSPKHQLDEYTAVKATLRHAREALADLIKSLIPRQSSILIISDDPLTTLFSLCEFSASQIMRLPVQYSCKIATFGWEVRNVLAALDSATVLSLHFGIGDIFNTKNPTPPHHHLTLMSEKQLEIHTSALRASEMLQSAPTIVFMLGDPDVVSSAMMKSLNLFREDIQSFLSPGPETSMAASLLDQSDRVEHFMSLFKAFFRRQAEVKVILDLSRFGAFKEIRESVSLIRDLLKAKAGIEYVSLDWSIPSARQRIASDVLVECQVESGSSLPESKSEIIDYISLDDRMLCLMTPEAGVERPLIYLSSSDSILAEPASAVYWKNDSIPVNKRLTLDVHHLQSVL
eukprot:Gregarina_sp_Poly_1__328@NODE_107_length_14129_cov_139_662779_g94_i0_p4_GENE_NODE_107_length_14129_cov_139_662779_g94_i0NODE_107_length_14129_cov_139_662779_g94_i0_p4_ORF_typecomplete_len541_score75_03_NODE_107_length_14129_cov_139_662779_g94_i01144513067